MSPNGDIPNRPEVKTDEELPAFCNPPNPCPLGFEGRILFFVSFHRNIFFNLLADDCDSSPMSVFTAEYSELYQFQQNCQCDKDHDQCSPKEIFDYDSPSTGVLKRSRRL